jgi:pimeloyl-ACP methyl ester carboxylesterase
VTPFVLVHGAFRGGWAWSRVRPALIAAGYDVHAPSLIGAGEHADRLAEATSLDVWVNQVAALVELEDLRDVVLVGHSQGALVTTGVAARLPERVGLLVHLDGAVPAAGQRAADLMPNPGGDPARELSVPPRPVDVDEYGAELAAWMDARMTASPVGPALDPIAALPAGVAEEFVFCARTPDGYPSQTTRARLDAEGRAYRTLAAGHDAPVTAPTDVARVLLGLAETTFTKGS